MTKRLKVGFDFDGVIAYNPFRIVRPILAFLKKDVLGVKKLKFWYPRHRWQQIFWIILHESSVFPANGIDQFKTLVSNGTIEAHLVTARYSFLDGHLFRWLDRHKLRKYFKTINFNKRDEQPHLFKERLINKHQFDVFVEDNLDIVKHLHGRSKTKIFWIYNLFDREYPHVYKYPYLGKALYDIKQKKKTG
jgi:hypothetical protein